MLTVNSVYNFTITMVVVLSPKGWSPPQHLRLHTITVEIARTWIPNPANILLHRRCLRNNFIRNIHLFTIEELQIFTPGIIVTSRCYYILLPCHSLSNDGNEIFKLPITCFGFRACSRNHRQLTAKKFRLFHLEDMVRLFRIPFAMTKK